MPLAKPYPIPDLIIPLDDDDFEEEEIEVHALQQQVRPWYFLYLRIPDSSHSLQVKQLSRLTEESAARLAYVIGDDVHDYRRTYYNLSMLSPEEQCALDSLRAWAVSAYSIRIGARADGQHRRLSIRRVGYAREDVRKAGPLIIL